MYSNKVEICGVNTAKLPVLKEQEKAELLRRCRKSEKLVMRSGWVRLKNSAVFSAFSIPRPLPAMPVMMWALKTSPACCIRAI